MFAERWELHNESSPNAIKHLLGDKDWEDVTERDEQVAATIIQWLGSPVGESFCREVNEDYATEKLRDKERKKVLNKDW